jgi:Uma2 family endonuclease
MTAEQLMDLPDDGQRRELVNGELEQTAPAGCRHGRVAARIARRLDERVQTDSAAPWRERGRASG